MLIALSFPAMKNSGRLLWMLAVSALLHATLLLVEYTPNVRKRQPAPAQILEVVLVNARTPPPPEPAPVLAQASLDHGGEAQPSDERIKTPLPAQKSPANAKPVTEPRKRLTELKKQTQDLITQLNTRDTTEHTPSAQTEPEQAAESSSGRTDQTVKTLDIARLQAEIAKELTRTERDAPRRKRLGSRTQEYRFAAYVEAWRQKVERIGNLNYPEEAKQNKLYGQLRMTVHIRADGSLENIELNESSGHKVLDDAARRIVATAAPYAEFPPDVRKDYDVISITRIWTFTREDSLASQ